MLKKEGMLTKKNPQKTRKNNYSKRIHDLFTTSHRIRLFEYAPWMGCKTGAHKYPPQCGISSRKCFGHTGYLRTSVWSDKNKNLIIIFLTNRIYPKKRNEEIKNIRPKGA
jgi:hypothetical protein